MSVSHEQKVLLKLPMEDALQETGAITKTLPVRDLLMPMEY